MTTSSWTVDATGDCLQTDDAAPVTQTRERMWLDAKHWARQGSDLARVKYEQLADNTFVITGRGYQLQTTVREGSRSSEALMHEKLMHEALMHTALTQAAQSSWSKA